MKKDTVIEVIFAKFLGEDGSCGFKNGHTYRLYYFTMDGKYYISRPSLKATAIPYDTLTALRKNWRIEWSDILT